MNKTVNSFVQELKMKPLDNYSLDELQIALDKCYHLYVRFKKKDEREILNVLWIKMAEWYNVLLKKVHPNNVEVYPIDFLKDKTH